MMKRTVLLALAALMTVSAYAKDYDFEYEQQYNHVKLYCKITKAATSTSTKGRGEVTFVGGTGPQGSEVFTDLVSYNGYDYTVTGIAKEAFKNATWIEILHLGYNVRDVDADAFMGCTGLKRLDIAQTVTLGIGMFDGCSGLTSVNIPQGVTKIDDRTFANCGELDFVSVGRDVEEVENTAFENTTIKNLEINSNKLTSGHYYYSTDPYYQNNLTCKFNMLHNNGAHVNNLTFGPFVTDISGSAFAYCNVKKVTIHENIKNIDYAAFERSYDLDTIYINSNALVSKNYSKDDNLFYALGLYTNSVALVFGEGVEKIGAYAFYNNFEKTGHTNEEWSYYGNSHTSVVFSSTLKTIGDYAFYESKINSLMLPDGLTNLGNCAFQNCTNLATVIIPSSYIGGSGPFFGCNTITTIYACSKYPGAYSSLINGVYDKSRAIVLVIDEDVYNLLYPNREKIGNLVRMYEAPPTPAGIREDVNEDGQVNSLDVLKVYKYMQSH